MTQVFLFFWMMAAVISSHQSSLYTWRQIQKLYCDATLEQCKMSTLCTCISSIILNLIVCVCVSTEPSMRNWPARLLRRWLLYIANVWTRFHPTSATVPTISVSPLHADRQSRAVSALWPEKRFKIEANTTLSTCFPPRWPERHQWLDADETDWWWRRHDGWEAWGKSPRTKGGNLPV